MKLIHPRRWLRKAALWYGNTVFRARCRMHHVHCVIGENTLIRHCKVNSKADGDGVLVIGSGCTLQGAAFVFYDHGGRIELKDKVYINAYPKTSTNLFVRGSSSIVIENHCLLSNSIDISTTDWHSLYDGEGHLLNPDKDVHIGKRVWIGRKVIICKGVSIPDDSVVGVGSVVTKSFDETNVVIAGNPAQMKKRGVHR